MSAANTANNRTFMPDEAAFRRNLRARHRRGMLGQIFYYFSILVAILALITLFLNVVNQVVGAIIVQDVIDETTLTLTREQLAQIILDNDSAMIDTLLIDKVRVSDVSRADYPNVIVSDAFAERVYPESLANTPVAELTHDEKATVVASNISKKDLREIISDHYGAELLTGGPILDNLDNNELAGIIRDDPPQPLIVVVRDFLSVVATEDYANATLAEAFAGSTYDASLADMAIRDLGKNTPENIAILTTLLADNLTTTQLQEYIITKIIQQRVLGSWTLLQSLNNYDFTEGDAERLAAINTQLAILEEEEIALEAAIAEELNPQVDTLLAEKQPEVDALNAEMRGLLVSHFAQGEDSEQFQSLTSDLEGVRNESTLNSLLANYDAELPDAFIANFLAMNETLNTIRTSRAANLLGELGRSGDVDAFHERLAIYGFTVSEDAVQDFVDHNQTISTLTAEKRNLESKIQFIHQSNYPDAELIRFNNWLTTDFLTSPQSNIPELAGVRQALIGSVMVMMIVVMVALPVGVGTAIYLEEYSDQTQLHRFIETNIRNLAGVPSIIYGMLGLAIFVRVLAPISGGYIFGTNLPSQSPAFITSQIESVIDTTLSETDMDKLVRVFEESRIPSITDIISAAPTLEDQKAAIESAIDTSRLSAVELENLSKRLLDYSKFTLNGRTVLAAGLTLALLILPIIIISAQEALRAVPYSIREASYGLGATKWQTIWRQVLPAAMPGIMTGTILAVSRAIGETAPLIVVGAATFMTVDPNGPFSAFTVLPIQIYQWTARPQAEFRNIAAAAIVVLLVLMLTLNAVAIILRNRYKIRY